MQTQCLHLAAQHCHKALGADTAEVALQLDDAASEDTIPGLVHPSSELALDSCRRSQGADGPRTGASDHASADALHQSHGLANSQVPLAHLVAAELALNAPGRGDNATRAPAFEHIVRRLAQEDLGQSELHTLFGDGALALPQGHVRNSTATLVHGPAGGRFRAFVRKTLVPERGDEQIAVSLHAFNGDGLFVAERRQTLGRRAVGICHSAIACKEIEVRQTHGKT